MQLQVTKKSADEENFDKMKAAYDACLNEDQIKKAGVAPLMHILDEIKKAYRANARGDLKTHALSDVILMLAKYSVSTLVNVGSGADDTGECKCLGCFETYTDLGRSHLRS
jgi:endothelin-converting enzyme